RHEHRGERLRGPLDEDPEHPGPEDLSGERSRAGGRRETEEERRRATGWRRDGRVLASAEARAEHERRREDARARRREEGELPSEPGKEHEAGEARADDGPEGVREIEPRGDHRPRLSRRRTRP